VPARIRAVIPEARLVYLVRDPAERAFSQFLHHVRDKHETRPLDQALFDPGSHYVSRSRYHERLTPYLDRFPREQILVIVQERLRDHPADELSKVLRHAGSSDCPDEAPTPLIRSTREGRRLPALLRGRFYEAVADDLERLRSVIADPLPEWSC
jgi:hypothetical protein